MNTAQYFIFLAILSLLLVVTSGFLGMAAEQDYQEALTARFNVVQNYSIDFDESTVESADMASDDFREKVIGDTAGWSFSFWQFLKYGLNPFAFNWDIDNPAERILVTLANIVKSTIIGLTIWMGFRVFKNKAQM